MMYKFFICIFGTLSAVLAKPAYDCPCGDVGPSYGYPLPPPISFLPVPQPQPQPIRLPQPCPPPSVTIPNIIVALLPPNQKPVPPRGPLPVPLGPRPVILPIPSPRPYIVPTPCDDGCLSCQ